MRCCQDLYVSSGCAVYENYPNIIGQYIGQNVVDDDGTDGFKYIHNSQNDVTLQLRMVSGIKRVCFSLNFGCWFFIPYVLQRQIYEGTVLRVQQSTTIDATSCPSDITMWRYLDSSNSLQVRLQMIAVAV